jgi:thiamine biosynthesis protein ThiS
MSESIKTISVHVNGDQRDVPTETTLEQLLDILEIKTTAIAIELNEQLVPHAAFTEESLSAGDQLEIVTLVGGG